MHKNLLFKITVALIILINIIGCESQDSLDNESVAGDTFQSETNTNRYEKSDNSNYEEYQDDEDFHQLIIFAISGLTGSSSGSRFMPFVNKISSLHGVHTSKARSVTSTYSLPGWISHFYSATPSEYGCLKYDCPLPPEKSGYKSIVDVLQYDYNYAVSIHSNHYPSEQNIIKKSLRDRYPVNVYHPSERDALVKIGKDDSLLPQTDKRLVIFHFHGLEIIAKSLGYDSHNYRTHVSCIDSQIKEITKSIWGWEPERSTFLVISDHGGKQYDHRQFNLESIQVPFAVWGYGISQGINLFSKSIDTTQISPTLLNVLEYDIPEEWNHPIIKNVKISNQPHESLVSYTLDDYNSENHTLEEHINYCIISFSSSHSSTNTIKIIFIIIFIVAFLVFTIFSCLLENKNKFLDW